MQNKVAALCGQLIAKVTLMILMNMRQSKEFRACLKQKLSLICNMSIITATHEYDENLKSFHYFWVF